MDDGAIQRELDMLLGLLALDTSLLDVAKEAGLKPEHFRKQHHREMFFVITWCEEPTAVVSPPEDEIDGNIAEAAAAAPRLSREEAIDLVEALAHKVIAAAPRRCDDDDENHVEASTPAAGNVQERGSHAAPVEPSAYNGRIETDDVDFTDDSTSDDEGNLLPIEEIEPPAIDGYDGRWEPEQIGHDDSAPVERIEARAVGKTASRRANKRKAEITALHYWNNNPRKPRNKAEFINAISQHCEGRNPCDPDDVSPIELGRVLQLTLARKMEIEDSQTRRGLAKGWTTRAGNPYTFRILTIAPYDVTAEKADKLYRCRNSKERAAKRKIDRNRGKTKMMENQQTSYATWSVALAAGRARRAEQRKVLLAAIDNAERTIADLMPCLAEEEAWYAIAKTKRFRRAISEHLDELKVKGLIGDRYEGNVRIVRRAGATDTTPPRIVRRRRAVVKVEDPKAAPQPQPDDVPKDEIAF
jgi:hypothetical protein